ncbi:MAG TPA: tRNA lysidine(34) synthetase TilS [Actinomycetota bacterium]|nr:tRNA lysidine(34) synthetase TilS [Actinomycetota bacterium]
MVEPGRVGGSPGGPGYDVVEKAAAAIEKHSMLSSGGGSLVVTVSGGPDSVCLLDVLARLSPRWGLQIEVAHVDHGLSEESAEIAARVGRMGAEAGFDVHVARAPDLSGSNLHARARDFRYEFFGIVAERIGADRVATGHTLDDRVETTLGRLIHGAGTRGLAGLRPVEGNRVRPLIDVRRVETRTYCIERELDFYDDPANADDRFERAKIRSGVLRMIEEDWGDGAVRAIARSAELLKEDAVMLEELADGLFGQMAKHEEEATSFDLDALKGIPRPFRRRLLERAVGEIRDRAPGIEAVMDALDKGTSNVPARFSLTSGIEVIIESDKVVVSRMPS